MSDPRQRFEAYLRAQVEGCVTDEAKAMGIVHRDHMLLMLKMLWRAGHADITIRDAVSVLALGEYLKPADPEERVRQGREWLDGIRERREKGE